MNKERNLWRFGKLMVLLSIMVLGFPGWSELEVVGSEKPADARQDTVSPEMREREAAAKAVGQKYLSESETCIVNPSAIEDLKKQKELIEEREKNIAAREGELAAREAAIAEEFGKLEALRDDFGKVDVARKQENDARVAKLVETFETMSPKAAAQVIGGLDESLAVASMSKISTQKLAKILNAMDPKKSVRLTELMAGVVRAKESPSKKEMTLSNDGAETAEMKRKGGEKQ